MKGNNKGRQSMLNQLKGQIVDQCIKTSKKIYNLNMYNWHMFYLACLKLWYQNKLVHLPHFKANFSALQK